ncbi:hypothetical protein AQPE_3029 [Aquipluma nitroreducens]|uniref:Uncharacterized protein n=1 Tax=Aquipluma nitroreducens TaxID=2010828 RepID=A0A5K7SBK4_9BACT|nr:hypothetical protein AQPE_3029 [Aquipluma nitroreducens]
MTAWSDQASISTQKLSAIQKLFTFILYFRLHFNDQQWIWKIRNR